MFHVKQNGNELLIDGPAMAALTQKQRDFVLAYVHCPTASGSDLCRMAGYAPGRVGTATWRAMASRMLRAPAIIAAINEVLGKAYRGRGAAIAQDVMLTIAQNPNHPQQLKAALALADRGGFGAYSEQKVTIEHRDMTSDAMIAKIERLAKFLGVDAGKLLGGRVIDGGGASEVGSVAVARLRDRSQGQDRVPEAGDGLPGTVLPDLGGGGPDAGQRGRS
jgi:hypothetical protein